MNAAAAPAAQRRSRRRRLHPVPDPAGSTVKRGPGHPLALGREARARLANAIRTLLDDPGIQEAPDSVRLAVIVLAAKTPSVSGMVEIRTGELGRWLGLSASYVASNVVPALRRSRAVSIDTAKGEFGQDDGLECRVLPLWETRDITRHPLALRRGELATFLRLLEAVMAPGWVHLICARPRDGCKSPMAA
ncbi:hypothetical protein [Streptomyces sp. NPDC054794]